MECERNNAGTIGGTKVEHFGFRGRGLAWISCYVKETGMRRKEKRDVGKTLKTIPGRCVITARCHATEN